VAEVDAKVMKFVEETLKKTPTIELEDLFDRAKNVSSSMAQLTKRQFNARYPLQVKRRTAQAKRKTGTGRKAATKAAARKKSRTSRGRKASSSAVDGGREKVRQVLLGFATDITGAEERKDLVKVLADVDRYVDQIMKGVAKG